jgi:hypothetical protein
MRDWIANPHIGEYAAKTNAICDFKQIPAASECEAIAVRVRHLFCEYGLSLLSVIFQHLIAGLAQFGSILLKASQNGEIALIDHRAAEALNVARASPLLLRRAAALLLLGDSAGGNR